MGMDSKHIGPWILLLHLQTVFWTFCVTEAKFKMTNVKPPNIIMFLVDDMGYGDLASYGHPTQEHTYADYMATHGLRLTQCYSAATFCTPSRAALLTGRQPVRTGMTGDFPVLLPCSHTGLPRSEITLAEALRDAGYKTGIVGKWHLGNNKYNSSDGYHLPQHHGFDYVGTILPHTLEESCDTSKVHRKQAKTSRCFLYEGSKLIQQPIRLEELSSRLLHDAQAFLYNQTQDHPFFLFMSFPQVHIPMFNMPRFKNTSRRGVLGDQIMEMSWMMKSIMATLQHQQLHHNTLSVFLSDHGPHREACKESGNVGHLRGGKGNFMEGGLRVPAILHWPSVIKQGGVIQHPISTLDLYPTLLELAAATPPNDRVIDGESFATVIINSQNSYRQRTLFFLCRDLLMAVRHKQYKIHYRTLPVAENELFAEICQDGLTNKHMYISGLDCTKSKPLEQKLVYNVEEDPLETFPLSGSKANSVLSEISTHIEDFMQTIQNVTKQDLLSMKTCVPSLIPCCNPPYCVC